MSNRKVVSEKEIDSTIEVLAVVRDIESSLEEFKRIKTRMVNAVSKLGRIKYSYHTNNVLNSLIYISDEIRLLLSEKKNYVRKTVRGWRVQDNNSRS